MRDRVWRWTAPANWPVPPPGFVPPPGWSPEEAWGPAPSDWQFWTLDEAVPNYERVALAGGVTPAVARVLGGLTPLERRLFGPDVQQLSLSASNRMVKIIEDKGFVAACYSRISSGLNSSSIALGWAGISAESWISVTHSHAIAAIVGMVLLFLLAIGVAGLATVRRRGAARAAREYRTSSQATLAVVPDEVDRIATPPLLIASMLLYGVDAAIIGAALVSDRFTAPRVTGLFFIAVAVGVLCLTVKVWYASRASKPITTATSPND